VTLSIGIQRKSRRERKRGDFVGVKNSLISYLLRYTDLCSDEEEITLVYRKTLQDHWGNRTKFLGSIGNNKYNHHLAYNHRSILEKEIIIEYDTDSPEVNNKAVDLVREKLKKDNIKYAKWHSGNKSFHLHFMLGFDTSAINYRFILKRTVMRYYGTFYLLDGKVSTEYKDGSKKLIPDIRLADDNHLVRSEFGVHEKTQKLKSLYMKDKEYPCLSKMPKEIWTLYTNEVKKHLERKATHVTKDLKDSKYIKYLLSTDFRNAEDGRERAMFILIQVLRKDYKGDKRKEFVTLMQDWYRYAGGCKMTPWQIQCKVNYSKDYTISETFIHDFVEELGVKLTEET